MDNYQLAQAIAAFLHEAVGRHNREVREQEGALTFTQNYSSVERLTREAVGRFQEGLADGKLTFSIDISGACFPINTVYAVRNGESEGYATYRPATGVDNAESEEGSAPLAAITIDSGAGIGSSGGTDAGLDSDGEGGPDTGNSSGGGAADTSLAKHKPGSGRVRGRGAKG